MATSEQLVEQPLSATEAVNAAFAEVPRPNAHEIHELHIVEGVAGSIAALALAANERIAKTSGETISRAHTVLDMYAQAADTDDSVNWTTKSYSKPGEVVYSGEVHATIAETHTLEYARLVELGAGKVEGIPEQVLATTDTLYDRAAADPALQEVLDFVSANTWKGILEGEKAELGLTLTAEDRRLHEKAHSLLSSITDNKFFHTGIVHQVTTMLGSVERTTVGAYPMGAEAQRQLQSITRALRSSVSATEQYIATVTDKAAANRLRHTPNVDGDMKQVERVLFGLAAGLGREVIPAGIKYSDLATAIATRGILRNPEHAFDPANTNQLQGEAVIYAGIAAMFDWHQDEGLSLTRAALPAREDVKAVDAGTVETSDTESSAQA